MGSAGIKFCNETLSQRHAIDKYEEWMKELVAHTRKRHHRDEGSQQQ